LTVGLSGSVEVDLTQSCAIGLVKVTVVCNYPGCQVQGSLFRGSTRTEPLYMRRALNWLRKNPGLTVQS